LLIVIDFETALTNGQPSLEYFREDFRVVSCAFAWSKDGETRTRYVVGESAIRSELKKIVKGKHKVGVHNLTFDGMVAKYRFPEFFERINWYVDTMRLVQLGDNGVGGGVGLQASAKRWLPSLYHDHKAPFHKLIEERGGEGGGDLHLLTPDELKDYTVLDAVVTLELFKTLTNYFKDLNYDWSLDHVLYRSTCWLVGGAKAEGVLVDRDMAKQNLSKVTLLLAEARDRFFEINAEGISAVKLRLREKALGKYKTLAGQARLKDSAWEFNMGSGQQLAMLFVDHYGIKPTFLTDKGAPSFASSFMAQWGERAAPMTKMGNLEITANQLKAVIELSQQDGRIRPDVRINGTVTGRGAAGAYGD
jgi:hypothetical protein